MPKVSTVIKDASRGLHKSGDLFVDDYDSTFMLIFDDDLLEWSLLSLKVGCFGGSSDNQSAVFDGSYRKLLKGSVITLEVE